jgi:hypothetical protein
MTTRQRVAKKGSGLDTNNRDVVVETFRTDLIASQVADVVQFAGGWMCDRAMAGWRVTVFLPDVADIRPLDMLGVRAERESAPSEAVERAAGTIAVCNPLYEDDKLLRRHVDRALRRGLQKLMVWPCQPRGNSLSEMSHVHHRLSRAARSFKARALAALDMPTDASPVECFLSLGRNPGDAPIDLALSAANSPDCVRYVSR